MKKSILTLVILAFSLASFAAIGGKGKPASEERQVSSFNSIELKCSADLYLFQGKSHKVVVEADGDIIAKIETYVESNTLIIDVKGRLNNYNTLKVYVTCVELEALTVSGSGDVYGDGMFNTDNFVLLVNGSGDVEMQMSADKVKCKINGSGDVVLAGETDRLYIGVNGSGDMRLDFPDTDECMIKLTGSGDIKITGSADEFSVKQVSSGDVSAFKFIVENCVIDKSGSGDTRVFVTGELAVTASGSGDVYYKGTPDITSISTSGSGDVRKAD
jgi:hypothetical protein